LPSARTRSAFAYCSNILAASAARSAVVGHGYPRFSAKSARRAADDLGEAPLGAAMPAAGREAPAHERR
jgi:hypothetical protein